MKTNMIRPVNGHLIIEPIQHKTFFGSEEKYEEIGIVVSNKPWYKILWPNKKDKVYFDSWLAAKYPKENSKNDDDYLWLVKFEDIRAIEKDVSD